VGQPQVTRTLEGEVSANRLSHAYLFTGSRGTGKTSCAKILAKAVNCLAPKGGNPCNACENCRGIDSGAILDVVEIDAASNRGIDDIRALREESVFTPAQAKYRVYIIDEVHMLTIEAFNALLKTLEEPAGHVIFILATTEVQKLPSTILSRCQRFDFRRIEPEAVAELLEYVAEQEGASITHEAAILIARIADGAARDALSLLDRCLAGGAKEIDAALVRDAAGIVGKAHLFALSAAIFKKDSAKALQIADELHKASFDAERLCAELVSHFRDLMIVKTVREPEAMILCTKDEMEQLKAHAALFSLEAVLRGIAVLTACAESLRRSKNGRIEVEMALVRLCSPELEDNIAALLERIAALEAAVAAGIKPAAPLPLFVTEQVDPARLSPAVPEEAPAFVKEADIPLPEKPPEENEVLPFTPDAPPAAEYESAKAPDTQPFGGEEQVWDSENETLPFDDEDDGVPFGNDDDFEPPDEDAAFAPPVAAAPPPFMQANFEPAAPPAGENALQGRVWDNVCAEIVRLCPPMMSMVKGAGAELRGSVLIFKTPNPVVNMVLSGDPAYCAAVSDAVKKVLHLDVSVKVELLS
jgi:DNA polymerase-3 subunit gamma/tau